MIFRYTYAQKLPGADTGFLERGIAGTYIKVSGGGGGGGGSLC